MTVQVNYFPAATNSCTGSSGVAIKVSYRYATDSYWSSLGVYNFNPSQFTINAVNGYTHASFRATKGGNLYVRAMIMDRCSDPSFTNSKHCGDSTSGSHYDNADALIYNLRCDGCSP